MNGAHSLLSSKETAVLDTVRQRGRVLTRIKEFGDGDQEYLSRETDVAEMLRLPEEDVLTCLHSLEGRGLVTCRTTAHARSSTEYVCEWTPAIATRRGDTRVGA